MFYFNFFLIIFQIIFFIGSFGVVYRADDIKTKQVVVVKKLTQSLTDDPINVFSQFISELWMMK